MVEPAAWSISQHFMPSVMHGHAWQPPVQTLLGYMPGGCFPIIKDGTSI